MSQTTPARDRDAAAVWLEHASANRGGNVFTLREYRTWLKAAGFRKLATIPGAPTVNGDPGRTK